MRRPRSTHISDSDPRVALPPRAGIVALTATVTGAAAGFIGVGGGEFRIPVLVDWLRLPLTSAGAVNLLIGLFTVALSLYRRGGLQGMTGDDIALVAVMGAVSLVGAGFGTYVRDTVRKRPLKTAICVYLGLVGAWMLYEAIAHREHVLLTPEGFTRLVLAAVVAFPIATLSGVFGVAGGEMRIPALMYLFGVPIATAGTLSLAVSLPTLAAGVFTDRRLGSLDNTFLRVGVLMGIASAAGVLIGAALISYADRNLIKGALGIILLLSTWHLATSR
jgi:uncharacterized protein